MYITRQWSFLRQPRSQSSTTRVFGIWSRRKISNKITSHSRSYTGKFIHGIKNICIADSMWLGFYFNCHQKLSRISKEKASFLRKVPTVQIFRRNKAKTPLAELTHRAASNVPAKGIFLPTTIITKSIIASTSSDVWKVKQRIGQDLVAAEVDVLRFCLSQ